jgi:hypothetical protein
LIESRGNPRFTLDGNDALEWHLDTICMKVLAGVCAVVPVGKLEGVFLGGGYGRGEGGVLRGEVSDEPYNDLEFYLLVRGNTWLNEQRHGRALHDLAERLTHKAGVEVEFKILSKANLSRSPVTMHYYDLVMGHRRLWGQNTLLTGCDHHRCAKLIPLSEATRLLMNRCSGLLFAKERLQHAVFTSNDADFVVRNLAKAQLAFGDVLLTAFGQYHWSCRERRRRLRELSWQNGALRFDEVRDHHAKGVAFKLRPYRVDATLAELQQQHSELTSLALQVWLWLERRRLNVPFASGSDYASNPLNKCPKTSGWRNWLINLRTFGPQALFDGRRFRYPRERLLNALPPLLWEAEALKDTSILGRLQTDLQTDATTFAELVQAYEALWRRFN